jgi:hypothetical protein
MAVSDARKVPSVSSYVSDTSLQPFLQRKFDPADYLNSTLPGLATSPQNTASRTATTSNANLADLSSQTQTLLFQLNAQASRLTTVLTQLTVDIIRSASRLAYEVDVLRGEALGLSEVVNDKLQKEIGLFTGVSPAQDSEHISSGTEQQPAQELSAEPQYISQLRMLTKVRQRLDTVIKIFGEAMQWTLPPSELSITSSFISVSAPEPGADSQSREQKGKEFAEKLRTEIADLILGADDPTAGLGATQARLDALRDLAQVWKGSAEEKARIRFVDNLTKLAEDRLRELERGDRVASSRTVSTRKNTGSSHPVRAEEGAGFLDSLYKLHKAG